MVLTELNDYSKRFCIQFVDNYPWWSEYIKSHSQEYATPGSIKITIPSPNLKSDVLYISTDNGEITVGFSHWHTHYTNYASDKEEEEFIGAFELIDEIINEKIVIVSFWHNDELCLSTNIDAAIPPDANSLIDMPHIQQKVNRVIIRSWQGALDKEYRI